MSEDTNKNLEQNEANVVVSDNNGVVSGVEGTSSLISENNNEDVTSNINVTGVVEEVSFNYPENEEVQSVAAENTQTVVESSQTVIDEPLSVIERSTTIEEVSINADSNSLETTEVSSDSVFNNNVEDVTSGALKEGQEYRVDKKGFPYGMVIGFVILIICALFIDNIVGFVENVILNKDATVEEKSNKENDKNNQKENENDSDEVEDSNNNHELDNNTNNGVNSENNDNTIIDSDINDDLNSNINSSVNG